LGETGDDGCVTVEKVPAIPIDVRVLSPEKSIGRGEFQKEFLVGAGKINLLEFRQKPVCNCLVSVVDVTDAMSHEGISVRFGLQDGIDNIDGTAMTNEDGACELEVQPGKWTFQISIGETTLPGGYCIYYPEVQSEFSVSQSDELQSAPPIYIGKGQLVKGKITGLDTSELRFDWIVLPNYIELESVEKFSIGHSGNLTVESRSPWILKWTADQ
jgi:hypothetical protein